MCGNYSGGVVLKFILRRTPWAKNYPFNHLKIHNSCKVWVIAMKFNRFLNISFLHVFTKNEVCWWNNDFEKLLRSQHLESFYRGKVMDSPTVWTVTVSLCRISEGWNVFPLYRHYLYSGIATMCQRQTMTCRVNAGILLTPDTDLFSFQQQQQQQQQQI